MDNIRLPIVPIAPRMAVVFLEADVVYWQLPDRP
jgi:hypothetical protein